MKIGGIMSIIKHDNIIYAGNINVIGGVEQYVYELIKKYKDNDIAVVCKTITPEQEKRMRKYCKVYKHTSEKIECKVIITNWDTFIINYVNEDAKVYTVVHSDYSHETQKQALPIDNPRITYICITEDSKKKFEEISGIKDRTILCRNPLTTEKIEKPLILMSATRLTKEKGGHRMLALANELDRQGIKYIWYVFTSNGYDNNPVWGNKNVIKMQNRLDLDYFYEYADWYIQLSEVEGDSYSLKQALYVGTPIVVCELPYFKEIGIENGKNAIYLDFDCFNVEKVAKALTKPLKFTFEPVKDAYDKILAKGKSHYEEERNMKVKVKANEKFEGIRDAERNVYPKAGDEWETTKERAEFLQSKGVIEIMEEIQPKKKVDEEVEKIIDKAYKKDVEEILEVGKKKTTKKNKKK